MLLYLPLVSREWKNRSNSSYNCTPFLHSLLTKGKCTQKARQDKMDAFGVQRPEADRRLGQHTSGTVAAGGVT